MIGVVDKLHGNHSKLQLRFSLNMMDLSLDGFREIELLLPSCGKMKEVLVIPQLQIQDQNYPKD